jgi:hypothetical protein
MRPLLRWNCARRSRKGNDKFRLDHVCTAFQDTTVCILLRLAMERKVT